MLLEGGLYGHQQHIYEDNNLQFGHFKSLTDGLLTGEIDGEMKEKIDGQALAVSMDVEHKTAIFARNVGNAKNFGENGLNSWRDVYSKFSTNNRDILKAFTFAARDLTTALESLSSETQQARFGVYDARVPKITKIANKWQKVRDKNGNVVYETVTVKNWLHFEIVWPETTNVIPYNHRLIVFHNYVAIDREGRVRISSDFNQFATDLQRELVNIGAAKQKMFEIRAIPNINKKLNKMIVGQKNKIVDFADKKRLFITRIESLQNSFGLSDGNTLGDFYTARIVKQIYEAASKAEYSVNADIVNLLVNRWLNNNKTTSISKVYKMIRADDQQGSEQFAAWVSDTETPIINRHLMQQVRQPIVDIVVDIGIEVMKNMTDFLALDPEQSSKGIRDSILKVVDQVRQSRDPDHIDQIEGLLNKLQRSGGLNNIIPTEGLMFTFRKPGAKEHDVYKLTGDFPVKNELNGFFRFGKAKKRS